MLGNDAQRAIPFNRSTPGVGTTLIGISALNHLDDTPAVSRMPALSMQAYLSMYQRVG